MTQNNRLLSKAKKIAKDLNIKNYDTLQISKAKKKRFSIRSPSGKIINFGLYPFKKGTYIDHKDDKLRKAWKARHGAIKLKTGQLAKDNIDSPLYYATRILW